MHTKKLRKVCSLIMAIIICITCVVNVSGCGVSSAFKNKVYIESEILDNIKNKADELYTEDVLVELYYVETYSTTLEKGTNEYVKDKSAYYDALNQQRLDSLGLTGYISAYPNKLMACVSLLYSSYNDWMENDYKIVASADSEELIGVSVCIDRQAINFADVNNLEYPYTKGNVYSDMGIPLSGNQYLGEGIKIGILELGYPDDFSNIGDSYYEILYNSAYSTTGLTQQQMEDNAEHVYEVYSFLGGSTGIAKDADLYFSAYRSDYSFKTALDLFANEDVDIINISNGLPLGSYRHISKYMDQVAEDSDIVFVVAAGNGSQNSFVNHLSTGLNCISVGSNNFDLRVSDFCLTNDGNTSNDYELLKPTITAPGGGLSGFGVEDIELSGTSFSSPIVAGVIAMLMDEFPILQNHPELVVSLITNTATKAMGQTNIVDEEAGFGIINYARARQYCNNLREFNMVGSLTEQSDLVYQSSVYVPSGSKLRVTAFVQNTVDNFIFDQYRVTEEVTPEFTPIYVTVQNQNTWDIGVGESYSNFTSVELVNNGSITAEFKIRVYAAEDKEKSEFEYCGIHYIVESAATPPHEHRYTYRIEQISGNHRVHRWYCDTTCGSTTTEPHTWESVGLHGAVRCKWCGFETNIMLNGVGNEEQYIK